MQTEKGMGCELFRAGGRGVTVPGWRPLMWACRRHGKVLEELHTMHALFMLTSEFALQSKKCCKDTCAMPAMSSCRQRMWRAAKTRRGSVNEKAGLRSTRRLLPKEGKVQNIRGKRKSAQAADRLEFLGGRWISPNTPHCTWNNLFLYFKIFYKLFQVF